VRTGRYVGLISALFVLALAPPALADDFDVLRGSQVPVGPATFTRWAGFYAGGQLSYGDAENNFARATAPLVGFSLRNTQVQQQAAPSAWQVLGRDASNAFGGGLLGGGSVGVGFDWALTPNFFLRGEFEYVLFSPMRISTS
jgi:hypothetical protein